MNRLKGYRTALVALALGILPLIDTVLFALYEIGQIPEWKHVIPPEYFGVYALLLAIAKLWLRHITDSPAPWRKRPRDDI